MRLSTKLFAILPAALFALGLGAGVGALADYVIKDGASATQTIKAFVCSSTKICPAHVLIDSSGNEISPALAANQTAQQNTVAPGTVATKSVLVGCIYNSSAPGPTTGQGLAAQCDSAGRWVVSVGSGTVAATQSGTWSVRIQDGAGNSLTSAARGSERPLSVQILDGSGNQITAFGGSGGTASNFGSAFPTPGTAVGFTDGTNMVAARVGDVNNVAAATNYLNAGVVGRYNATQPTLTDTRYNFFQLSARGALYVAPGTEGFTVTANAGTNLNTSALGTSANQATIIAALGAPADAAWTSGNGTHTALLKALVGAVNGPIPAGTAIIGALVANQSVNVAQINGVTPLMGNGATGTGSQRVTIASDNTAFTVNSNAGPATIPAATTMQSAAVANGNGTSLNVNGFAVAILNVVSGTAMSGGTTVNFEASVDDTTWVAILAHQVGVSGNFSTTTTIDGDFRVATAGYKSIRARISGYSAGSTTIKGYASPTPAQSTTVTLADNSVNYGLGQVTSAMTGTTSTALTGMGAPGAGLRWYITDCVISNTHATVGTMVNLQDGSGGSVIGQLPAAAVYGGAATSFRTPIRQPTTNTGVFAVNATTGASTFVTCTGYKGI